MKKTTVLWILSGVLFVSNLLFVFAYTGARATSDDLLATSYNFLLDYKKLFLLNACENKYGIGNGNCIEIKTEVLDDLTYFKDHFEIFSFLK